MKNRIKNIVKQVFLTEDENKRLLALMANEKESNFSAFARKKLFYQEIESWTINFPEYEQLTERFIQIGRSINRIAKFSTQVGNISQQNFIELGQLITQLLDELEKGLSVNLKKKFHFALFRNLVEKTATFLRYGRLENILLGLDVAGHVITSENIKLYTQLIDLYTHNRHADLEYRELPPPREKYSYKFI